jgi:hypothetical protein
MVAADERGGKGGGAAREDRWSHSPELDARANLRHEALGNDLELLQGTAAANPVRREIITVQSEDLAHA